MSVNKELTQFLEGLVAELLKRGYLDLNRTEEECDAILEQVLDEKFEELKRRSEP